MSQTQNRKVFDAPELFNQNNYRGTILDVRLANSWQYCSSIDHALRDYSEKHGRVNQNIGLVNLVYGSEEKELLPVVLLSSPDFIIYPNSSKEEIQENVKGIILQCDFYLRGNHSLFALYEEGQFKLGY